MKTATKLPEGTCRGLVLPLIGYPYTFCGAPAELFEEPRYTTRRWYCAEHIPRSLCIAFSWRELQRLRADNERLRSETLHMAHLTGGATTCECTALEAEVERLRAEVDCLQKNDDYQVPELIRLQLSEQDRGEEIERLRAEVAALTRERDHWRERAGPEEEIRR
jgi:hypothetical protein